MKKTGFLIGFIIIVISIPAAYLLFNTNNNNKTALNSSPLGNDIPDKKKTEKLESNNLTLPIKERKPSHDSKANSNIPGFADKPEHLKTLLDPRKDDKERNEAANSLHASEYEGLTDDLITVLNNQNEKARFRSFTVQHLSNNYAGAEENDKQKIREIFYKALTDRHIEVRREVLLSLVRIGDPKGKETAVAWLTAKEKDNVRDLAIRCLHMLSLKKYIPAIRQYLYDKNEVIRIAAIVSLSQWGDRESRDAFEKAANSKSVRLQRAGKAALKRLDGNNLKKQDFPTPAGPGS